MFHRMPFIGRHIELNQIDEVIQQWDTRQVICLHGPGGIGKTRLLEEICLQHKPNNSLLTASIIDFDDLALFCRKTSNGKLPNDCHRKYSNPTCAAY